jgi:hypothetical protein
VDNSERRNGGAAVSADAGNSGCYCCERPCQWSTAYPAVAMMAKVTTHKMTKLDKLCVVASEWSTQLRLATNAVSSKKRMAFRMCKVGAPGSRRNMPNSNA